jgi:hypothetical protein
VFDEVTTAIITGAAGNIVAHILSGRAEVLRTWIERLFHGQADDLRSRSLRSLEHDGLALAQGTTTEADVAAQWRLLLSSLLNTRPDLRGEIQAMASASAAPSTLVIGSQRNSGSGTFIGGNSYGAIHIGAPQDHL